MPLQQATFENIVAKGSLAHNFCCQNVFSIVFNNLTLIIEIFHVFANILSKSFATDLMYGGQRVNNITMTCCEEKELYVSGKK